MENPRQQTIDKKNPKSSFHEIEDEETWKNWTWNSLDDNNKFLINFFEEEVWINAKTNTAMELAIEENKKKEDLSVEEIIPQTYHEYLDVFDEEKANRFPEPQSWDHKIEMK